jgi:subtilisin family serine protease
MKRLFQCLSLVALLALAGWWLAGLGRHVLKEVAAHKAVLPALAVPVQKMQRDESAKAEERHLEDRFAHCPVIEKTERVIEKEGKTWVRRLRLLRDETQKYSLLRVEDELIRTAQGDQLQRQIAMVGDHVMVKLRDPSTTDAALLSAIGDERASVRKRLPASGIRLVAFAQPKLDTVPRAVSKLAALTEQVLIAEPDHVVSIQATPNDPSFSSLWGLHNTGQSGGTVNADIDAPQAWDIHTGSRSVVVAVLDTGIDQTHPDLVANLWTNLAEIAGNGIDDDGNGYVDDRRGWDFVNDDNNPSDDNSHGTHCAGTIGALGNNAAGVSGVCWQVSLVGLKFLGANGLGLESDGAEALSYATDLGVTLTSNSWTTNVYSQTLKDAVDEAGAAGILCVAAAGNNGNNLQWFPVYPAAFTSANVISVAATTRNDDLWASSNYNVTLVDLAAPGVDIFSTLPSGGYGLKSGTSMATPHVAGACALLKSLKPALTHTQVQSLILNRVNPLPALTGKCVTGGRLNVYNSMLAASDILVTPTNGLTSGGVIGGPFAPATQTLTLTNFGSATSGWTATVDRSWISLSVASGILAPGASQTISVTLNAGAAQLLAATHTGVVTVTSVATGRIQTRAVTLAVAAAPVFTTNLNADPGWPRTGQWAFGVPQGLGGAGGGSPDPTAGATGLNVLGVNLAGDFDVNQNTPQYVTAGPFNLSDRHDTHLRYQRWLNTDFHPWSSMRVEVSTNGTTWSSVWSNQSVSPRDAAWVAMDHDLAALVDGQSQVFVRWVHEITSSGAYALSGWNLDDIEITAIPDKQLRLVMPAPLTEGGTVAAATIMVAPAPTSNLVLTLTSGRPGEEVSFPSAVTLLAGQTEVNFNVTPINDTRIDGTQSVTLTATAATWPSSSASVSVHDNESGNLTLILPVSVTEGGSPVTNVARVTLPSAAVVNIEVPLSSSDLTELTVPASVTILQGQTQAFFTLTMPEDNLLDGSQSATVTASVVNWPVRTASLQVLDNESTQLAVSLPAVALESAGTLAGVGRVSVQGILVSALTVNLSSNDLTELTVPASMVIPAGSSEGFFNITLVNDALNDGAQTVQVTASAAGFLAGSTTMSVMDDELPALPTTPSPVNGFSPTHPEADLAWSFDALSGGAPTSYEVYFGTLAVPSELLGNVVNPAFPLPRLEPATVYYWRIISKRGAQSRQGPVWSFTTAPIGPVHHLGWANVPAAVIRGSAFNGRVTAYDVWDNKLTGFAGPVALAAFAPAGPVTTGEGTFPWFFPLATYYHDARTQAIYLPSEVGAAGRLTSLALDVTQLPGQMMNDFTIRLKHTARNEYPSNNRTWESSGWVTVYNGTVTISALGWRVFEFSTPFDYDGVQNLMVDICFNNSSYTSDGKVRSTITVGNRTLGYTSDSGDGSPLSWDGTSPQGIGYNTLSNLTFTRSESPLSMMPAVSGVFTQGSWSGSLTIQTAADDAWLRATLTGNPAITGQSSLVDVVAVNDFALHPEPPYTGGLMNVISWDSLGASYEYEIQRATMSNFSDAVSTGYISAFEQTYPLLTEGQLYHYRGRARAAGLEGQWSQPQRSTQDATPPTLNLTPGTGGVVINDHLQMTGTGLDASGISVLSVNGSSVSTANAFVNWTQSLTALIDGVNTFTLSASDNAVPENTRTEQWSILRISDPSSDADQNGVQALFEYAFNAGGPQGMSALPAVSRDGQHLRLSFRRRIMNPSNVQYLVETSTTLTSWQAAGSNAQVISVVPTGDGVTESVTVRLSPSMNTSSGLFVRLRLEVP